MVDGSLGRRKIAASRGGRAQRAQRRGGGLGPRPCVGFAGPPGPQNAAAPRRNPTTPAYPRASAPPPALRRLPGAQEGSGRPAGAAAFRGRGQRPRPLNMPAAGLARLRAGGRRPPAAAPLRRVFHQRQKTQQKAGLSSNPAPPVHHPEKGGSDREPLRNSYPKATAASPVAGYGLRPPTVAVARLSPCAQHQPSRRASGPFSGEEPRTRMSVAVKELYRGRAPGVTRRRGKAAAHALRAAAAPSAPPRAAAAGQPNPLLRDARCPRRARVGRRELGGGGTGHELDAGVVVGEDLLEVSAFQGHGPGAVLAHTHPMAVAGGGNGNGILGKVQGEIGAAQI